MDETGEIEIVCPVCNSSALYTYGHARGAQRYICLVCNRQFVPGRERIFPRNRPLCPHCGQSMYLFKSKKGQDTSGAPATLSAALTSLYKEGSRGSVVYPAQRAGSVNSSAFFRVLLITACRKSYLTAATQRNETTLYIPIPQNHTPNPDELEIASHKKVGHLSDVL